MNQLFRIKDKGNKIVLPAILEKNQMDFANLA